MTTRRDLLLDVGVPFKKRGGVIFVESQAYNGLLRWLDHFPRITLCAPVFREGEEEPSFSWIAVDSLMADGRLNVSPFPWAYDIQSHLKHASAVRRALRKLIPQHRYLCFSNLGWLGAWGRIAAEEAHKSSRPYSVWLDWVLHEMPAPREAGLLKRTWRGIQRNMLRRTSIRDIQRSSLGLFHGRTVFDAYGKICKIPKIVHDVHLGQEDIISAEVLERRLQRLKDTPRRLRIIYVGRVHDMKGPWAWLDVMQDVIRKTAHSLEIRADWIGDGPLLDELRAAVHSRGLAASVSFPGAETNRHRLLEQLRDADLFVFCHLTPESPRCLIEALMSGSPIVGFYSAYAADLLRNRGGGGTLVQVNDKEALSRVIIDCAEHPAKIAEMAVLARSAGCEFSDVAVFRHRSELIKEYL